MSQNSERRTIGHIEIERELGRGGMGVVRLGHQPGLDRPVVVKTLRRALADDPTQEERFLREARSAAAVHHQNVVAVYDCFTWRSERFIVQEYVDGVDLSTVLGVTSRIAPRIAGLIALELVRGLEEIHALGIVHRDLKPSNILLSRAGAAKIADFGIALGEAGPGLTQTGHAVGTPLYMSPEQLLGERADARSDLFSLGVVMYEMLTGRVPFADVEDDPGGSLVRRMQSGNYPRLRKLAPQTPRVLARLVKRCLRARAGRRPASATALREGLERCVGAVSPGACRAEIAAWVWAQGVFRPGEDGTVAVMMPVPTRRVWRARLAWSAVASLAALMLIDAIWIHSVEPPAWLAAGWSLATEGSGVALAAAKAIGPAASPDWDERRVEPTRPDVIEAH